MSDYASIMTTSWDELPKPKLLPEGSWYVKGRNAAYIEPKGDGSPKVVFFYKVVEPMTDVSAVALEALGADYDFSINDLVHTIYVESTADWQKKVLPHLAKHSGFVPGPNPQEALKNFKGTEVVTYLGQRQWQDKTTGEEHIDNAMSGFLSPEAK